MVIIFIKMRSLPEKLIELKQTLEALMTFHQNKEGCLDYRIFQDLQNENSFCLIGNWKSRKHLDAHLRSDSFRVLKGTRSLLSSEPDIMIHNISDSEGLTFYNLSLKKKI